MRIIVTFLKMSQIYYLSYVCSMLMIEQIIIYYLKKIIIFMFKCTSNS